MCDWALEKIESEFFGKHNHMVLPELLKMYYEQGDFELAYYFSQLYLDLFETARFYKMMSLMEMSHYETARVVYKEAIDNWFDILRQHKVYWKHVILFALYFKLELPEYYTNIINQYYDSSLVALYDCLTDGSEVNCRNHYSHLFERYPVIKYIWAEYEKKSSSGLEKLYWSMWKKHNDSFQDCANNMKNVYNDIVQIFSYKPNETSPSMHIITDGKTTIILDCGCELINGVVTRIPVKKVLDSLNISEINCAFISHAHMDHYGSLNELRNTKIYMTNNTKRIIRYISPEIFLECTEILSEFSAANIDGVEVRFIPNGHIIGSVLMDIDWKGMKRIVYSGDFNVEDSNTVDGLNVDNIIDSSDKKIDVLIIETTYGKKKDMLSLKQYEKIFVSICLKMFTHGKKVFIPCLAVGRAQEAAMLLKGIAEKYGMKILIDGMAVKITEYYQLISGKSILGKNISICNSELEITEKIANNDIFLASSGMMKVGSTSYKYFENIIKTDGLCVIKIGFTHQYEHVSISLENRKNKNIEFIDIPLSAHASYKLLLETIELLSPDYVVYVHGSGIDK